MCHQDGHVGCAGSVSIGLDGKTQDQASKQVARRIHGKEASEVILGMPRQVCQLWHGSAFPIWYI